MKNFIDYLAESTRTHTFFIKFAVKPDDDQVNRIESRLRSYDLREMTQPEVVVEDNHKDFIGVKNRNVHVMKVVIGVPVSQYMLLQDVQSSCGISESLLAVRSANEPIEVYSQTDAWSRRTDKEEIAGGMRPAARLSTDRFYTEAEQSDADDLFGDKYNNKLLQYLAGVAESRPSNEVDPQSPLFSWIQMEDVEPGTPIQDTTNFNAHIKGAPMPVTSGSEDPPVNDDLIGSTGGMSDNSIPTVKFFRDSSTGKTKQVRKPMETN